MNFQEMESGRGYSFSSVRSTSERNDFPKLRPNSHSTAYPTAHSTFYSTSYSTTHSTTHSTSHSTSNSLPHHTSQLNPEVTSPEEVEGDSHLKQPGDGPLWISIWIPSAENDPKSTERSRSTKRSTFPAPEGQKQTLKDGDAQATGFFSVSTGLQPTRLSSAAKGDSGISHSPYNASHCSDSNGTEPEYSKAAATIHTQRVEGLTVTLSLIYPISNPAFDPHSTAPSETQPLSSTPHYTLGLTGSGRSTIFQSVPTSSSSLGYTRTLTTIPGVTTNVRSTITAQSTSVSALYGSSSNLVGQTPTTSVHSQPTQSDAAQTDGSSGSNHFGGKVAGIAGGSAIAGGIILVLLYLVARRWRSSPRVNALSDSGATIRDIRKGPYRGGDAGYLSPIPEE